MADVNKVITSLRDRISDLILENAVLSAEVADLVDQLADARAESEGKNSPKDLDKEGQ